MERNLFFSLLVLLVTTVHGIQEHTLTNHIFMPGEFESWNVEGGDQMVEEAFEFSTWTSEGGGSVLVNVDSFGAVGDGFSDDTQVSSCANLKRFNFIGGFLSFIVHTKKKKVVLVISKINGKMFGDAKNIVLSQYSIS